MKRFLVWVVMVFWVVLVISILTHPPYKFFHRDGNVKVERPLEWSFNLLPKNSLFNPPDEYSSNIGYSVDITRLLLLLVSVSIIPGTLVVRKFVK